MKHSKIQWTLVAACLLLGSLAASAQVPDIERFWTTVGSAGTLDEKSTDKVFFEGAVVQKGTRSPGIGQSVRVARSEGSGVESPDSAVIRYNVTAVDGLFGLPLLVMSVRFLDEAGARVVARLVEIDLASGAEVTRLTFDSDNALGASGYHVDAVSECSKEPAFDFVKKAYYIEATLTTNSLETWSAAGIEAIQLGTASCPN